MIRLESEKTRWLTEDDGILQPDQRPPDGIQAEKVVRRRSRKVHRIRCSILSLRVLLRPGFDSYSL
jgi:hypothetical protein